MENKIEIEIINIEDKDHRFVVEYELIETRERKKHGFPKHQGWEIENRHGVPKFINALRIKEAREYECRCDKETVKSLCGKYKGQRLQIDVDEAENEI